MLSYQQVPGLESCFNKCCQTIPQNPNTCEAATLMVVGMPQQVFQLILKILCQICQVGLAVANIPKLPFDWFWLIIIIIITLLLLVTILFLFVILFHIAILDNQPTLNKVGISILLSLDALPMFIKTGTNSCSRCIFLYFLCKLTKLLLHQGNPARIFPCRDTTLIVHGSSGELTATKDQ